MDGRAQSPSPWEILINLRPGANGYDSAPSPAPLPESNGEPGRVLLVAAYHGQDVPLACYLWRHTERARLYISMHNLDGTLRSQSYYGNNVQNQVLFFEDWLDPRKIWNAAAMNGRLFLAGGDRPYAIFDTGDVWMRGATALAVPPHPFAADMQHIVWPVTFRSGLADWPYLTGSFHAGICCAHLGWMFWSGFQEGQTLTLDRALTGDQRFLLPEQVVTTTSFVIGPHWLCWSDRHEPLSIGAPNFLMVPGRYAIKALASFRDRLVIVTEGDVWALIGQLSEEFVLRQVSESYGAQDARTICSTPHGVVFAGPDGIFITDGDTQTRRLDEPIDHLFGPGLAFHCVDGEEWDSPWRLTRQWGQIVYWAGRDEVWVPVKHASAGRFGVVDMAFSLVYRFDMDAWYLVAQTSSATAWTTCVSAWAVVGNRLFGGGNRHVPAGATDTMNTVIMAPPPNGQSTDRAYFMQSKPFLREQQNWFFGNAINVAFGCGFENGERIIPGRLTLWGEQQAYEAAPSLSSQVMTKQHPDCPAALKWGGSKWGETKWVRGAEFNVRAEVDVQTKYLRFALLGYSANPVQIRGFEIDYRQARGKEVG